MRSIQAERQAINNAFLEVNKYAPRTMSSLVKILARYGFDLSTDGGNLVRIGGEPIPAEVMKGLTVRRA